jgi:hypothetical protein
VSDDSRFVVSPAGTSSGPPRPSLTSATSSQNSPPPSASPSGARPIDYRTVECPAVFGKPDVRATRAGNAHGLAVWFDANLIEVDIASRFPARFSNWQSAPERAAGLSGTYSEYGNTHARSPRAPYRKPAFRFEKVFETMALSCAKQGQGNCGPSPPAVLKAS